MKKVFLIFYIILANQFCFGQNRIEFSLYGKYSCHQDKTRKISFFALKRNNIEYIISDNSKVLKLDSIGTYKLSYVMDDIDTLQLGKSYTFDKFILYQDTLNLIKIRECMEATTNPRFSGYCCCDEICEGEQIDYYINGNKRIEGFFKEGYAIGKLKIYYPNGSFKAIKKYNKRGILKNTKKYKEGEYFGCEKKK